MTRLSIVVRAYEPSELDRIIAIWRAATVVAHPFLTTGELDRDEALIRTEYMAATETWCAHDGDRLAGFVSLMGHRIVALFVDPAAHRAGVGSQLMAHVNALHGPVSVEVFADNRVAVPFYERHGFCYVRDEPSPLYPDHTQWLMAQPGAAELEQPDTTGR